MEMQIARYPRRIVEAAPAPDEWRHIVLLDCGHGMIVAGDLARYNGIMPCTRCQDADGEKLKNYESYE